ncbi:MAG: uracil-DNA glycosylase [Spirochaetes bacterium]|nr:uracil-DNA glycosylase [Spirochaetota bacterium]
MKNYTKKFWDILNLIEDYEKYGFEDTHSEVSFSEGTADSKDEMLKSVREKVKACRLCGLSGLRTNSVPGEGAVNPLVMVIGEGPGAEEDKTGRPFVGRAGRYLDKWLDAVGLSREKNCFIGNIVKCRPPNNRDPKPEESFTCFPYLEKQIEILKPEVILTVGRIASQIMTGRSIGIGALRGKLYHYKDIPLVTTYHPSGVLRNPSLRPRVWDDLKLLKTVINNG